MRRVRDDRIRKITYGRRSVRCTVRPILIVGARYIQSQLIANPKLGRKSTSRHSFTGSLVDGTLREQEKYPAFCVGTTPGILFFAGEACVNFASVDAEVSGQGLPHQILGPTACGEHDVSTKRIGEWLLKPESDSFQGIAGAYCGHSLYNIDKRGSKRNLEHHPFVLGWTVIGGGRFQSHRGWPARLLGSSWLWAGSHLCF